MARHRARKSYIPFVHPLPFRPRFTAGLLLAAVLATPAGARQVAEVQVVPESVTLAVGDRRPILATAFDAAGNVLAIAFTFRSTDTSVVAVDATGALLARRPGLARVEARAGGRTGAVTVAVRGTAEPSLPTPSHPRVESLLLEPGPATGPVLVRLDLTRRLTIVPKDSADADIPGVTIGWESADSTIARVDSAGLVRGARAGATTITARVPGFRPVVWEVRVVVPVPDSLTR
jgi:alpha-amylase